MKHMKATMTVLIAGSMILAPVSALGQEKVVKPVKVVGIGEEPSAPPSANVYPDGALMHSYQEELAEIKRAEETERRAEKARFDYEKRKVEAEKEIAAKKYRIEGLKLKQEAVQSEMDAMATDLADVEKQYVDSEKESQLVEEKAAEHFAKADSLKKDLAGQKDKYEKSFQNLKDLKEQTAKNMNKNSIDIQKMRSEVSVLEAEIESLEASVANVQAEELRVRTEWISLKAQIEDKAANKATNLAKLGDAKKKYDQAVKDYKTAQNEFSSAEKSRAETEARVNSEIRKLDESTAAAQRSRALAMAEKIRVEAETEKLNAYVSAVKRSNTDTIEAMKESQSAVMESRLALETARSELTREVAGGEKMKFQQDKIGARLRGLASVAEASDMMEGGRAWQITKSCKIQKRPTDKSEAMGEVSVGDKLVGATSAGSWVKIMNASGGAAYVKANCGKFE